MGIRQKSKKENSLDAKMIERLALLPEGLAGRDALVPYLVDIELVTLSQNDQWGRWYEGQLNKKERLSKGQHFTENALCDLMLALTVESSQDRILEPGCGAGAFLLRAYEQLEALGNGSHEQRLEQLVGVELDSKAAFLSAIQLMRASENEKAKPFFPNLWVGDFLSSDFKGVPDFDVIIGNPPYVRYEHLLQQERFCFATARKQIQHDYLDYLNVYPEQEKLFRGNSDLYLWFFLKSTQLLRTGGRLAFVTSNAWLTASYGKVLQEFIDHHFERVALLEPLKSSCFQDAAINPLVIVLKRKKGQRKKRQAEMGQKAKALESGRLLRFNKDLSSILPSRHEKESMDYWSDCHSLSYQLLSGGAVDGVDSGAFLSTATNSKKAWQSWGFQLRTLNRLSFLFEKSERGKLPYWTDLESLGKLRYPLKTGINQFFYVTPERVKRFAIEPEFLFPVLKSSKEITRLMVERHELSFFLFSCTLSLEELEKQGKTGALNYIQWGAQQETALRQKRQSSVLWPEVPSVQGRKAWYQLRPLKTADILCPRFFDRRFFFPLCEEGISEDQTFYGLTLKNEGDSDGFSKFWISALLNSTVSYLLVEFLGRSNLGEGLLQYSRQDMANLPVLNPELYSEKERAEVLEAYKSMMKRPIETIEKELFQSDRQALDKVLLRPFEARECGKGGNVRETLVSSLLNRVSERTERIKRK